MASFGKDILNEFLLDKEYIFLNHGSWGAIPKVVHEANERLHETFESQPDRWFSRHHWDVYKENLQELGDFIGTDPNNIVFERNTTTGISTVIRDQKFSPGDKILLHTWTYRNMKSLVNFICKNTGAEVVMVDLSVPLERETVIKKYKDAIAQHEGRIKFAIIDYICSVPPVLMPWRELSSLCHANNIQVLMDGAHTPGHVQLDLDSMDTIDYFVGDLHKWAFTHRGCAVLYVNPKLKTKPVPLAISASYVEKDDWRAGFFDQGTDACSKFSVVKDALKFIKDKGYNNVMAYNRTLVKQAASLLVARWGTHTLEISSDMEAPNMRMVRVPDLKNYPADGSIGDDNTKLYYYVMDRFKIVSKFVSLQNKTYVRICATIYNTLDDYERLADVILTLKQEETN